MFSGETQTILGEWGWIILSVILLILEILVPTVFFIFFAIAAFIVAGVHWIYDFGWQIEVIMFAAIGFLSMLYARKRYKKQGEELKDHPINDPMAVHIGKVYNVENAIEDGVGKIKIADSLWRVEGADCEVGSKVKIIDKKDQTFIVEPA